MLLGLCYYKYSSSNLYIVINTDISNDIHNINVIYISNLNKKYDNILWLTYKINFNILEILTDKIKIRLIFVFDNWLTVDILTELDYNYENI